MVSRTHSSHPMNRKQNRKILNTKNTITKIVKREILKDIEHKYHERMDIASTLQNVANYANMDIITQGLGDFSVRTGDQITPLSYTFRYYVTNNALITVPARYRVILFTWFDDASTPTLAKLFTDNNTFTSSCMSPYHHDQRQKFKVLYDSKCRVLPPTATAVIQPVRKSGKFPTHSIKFTAGSSTSTNGVWLFYFTDNTANFGSITTDFRLNYLDA